MVKVTDEGVQKEININTEVLGIVNSEIVSLISYTKGTCHLVITPLIFYTKGTRHLVITILLSYTKGTRTHVALITLVSPVFALFLGYYLNEEMLTIKIIAGTINNPPS
jgi:hypothetical protein